MSQTVVQTIRHSESPSHLESELKPKSRPQVRGKFLFVGDQKLLVRGITYGTFRPDADGHEYPAASIVESDFKAMASCGINAVRVYTIPPRWLMDAAQRNGLFIMAGLALERFMGYLTDTKGAPDLEGELRKKVRSLAGHPALLCHTIANEIPASTVRWLGRRRVETFLRKMFDAIKEEDPGALVTYVNYPSTEYLELPFLDLVSFNVYLEDRETLDGYLARLHSLSGDRPLLMSEVGLDSYRNGELKQAEVLDWQVRTAFAAECAGVFVYAWTDEWHRGGEDVFDWEFGLTRRDRTPKPALASVSRSFSQVPFPPRARRPKISVVVCSYNGSRTIRDTFEGLQQLEYPDYEVIVVDDGSTDSTASIAAEYDVNLIRITNHGLSHARNVGAQAATGEIVAYIDDDAYPDPHWLDYVAARFESGDWVAVGGPNLAPPGDGPIADCVANAPGGPLHVLLSDREAEHIPGCNMAFRKTALDAINGFDTQFRVAGDDVDLCWRLMERGGKIGFSAAAVVWHHRRNSIRTYWKQQRGYGRAEALLEQKWPEKYNVMGHAIWSGRVYGAGLMPLLGAQWRIYHGLWGSAPFQFLYNRAPSIWQSLPQMPEWWMIVAALFLVSAIGLLWAPLLWSLPIAVAALMLPVIQAIQGASRARFKTPGESVAKLRLITFALFFMQPIARLWGRFHFGLHPWRLRAPGGWCFPKLVRSKHWADKWRSPESRLSAVLSVLREDRVFTRCGGDFDPWELETRGGLLGAARLLLGLEELGGGCQMVRFQIQPTFSKTALLIAGSFLLLAILSAIDGAGSAAGLLFAVSLLLIGRCLFEAGAAVAALRRASRAGE